MPDPSVTLLRQRDYRAMPWKNGGGITHEILREQAPAGSDPGGSGDFAWRLSIATIERSGPFSTFPHCDRVILLLDGDGVALDMGAAGTHSLDRPHVPFRFAGETPVDCRLLGGRSRDLNLMVDRRFADASCFVLSTESSAGLVLPPCSAALVVALGGPLNIALANGIALAPGDAAALVPPGSHALHLQIDARASRTSAFVAALTRR
ncbi:MAG: HutD family protein [Alphaproteobacteria bacterium]|nr:HutD family protein [Alphaproteobacteria bacterium]